MQLAQRVEKKNNLEEIITYEKDEEELIRETEWVLREKQKESGWILLWTKHPKTKSRGNYYN